MDAFYASIEQRDFPELRGRPLAVGYAGARGVVAAASYEARAYGVRSAMASQTALKKCPGLLFRPARFDVYRRDSEIIRKIFLEYTDLVEPLSLDEAYLDVTRNHQDNPSATRIAREIKRRIKEETGLTASAGVSYNKFLAKIASDYRKPDGLLVIPPEEAERFVAALPIESFYGIGKVTAEKMHRMGIHTGEDLRRCSERTLREAFGKAGESYYRYARAIDDREVSPSRARKSLGAETTFMEDLGDREALHKELEGVRQEVWERLMKRGFYGRTVTLKVKYSDFRQITRSRTLLHRITDRGEFHRISSELLEEVPLYNKVRLLGISVSNPEDSVRPYQLRLEFPEP